MKNILLSLFILIISINKLFPQKVILMDYKTGVYQIPCTVNGIKMKFIFDTGASDVTISKTEAEFLIKQGLLTKEDIIGKENYQIADGTIKEGIKIILKEIKIEDLVLKNITATIIENSNAPLLLGQSAISKLGRIEINKNKLIIYPRNERNHYKFLEIDLTKKITDFGLSGYNLIYANPYISLGFDELNISTEHSLEKFNFENQNILFDKKGNISLIVLQKKPKGEYPFQKEKFAEEFYLKLKSELNQKYWISENEMSRYADWKSENFEISIHIDSENSVLLIYYPKIIMDVAEHLTETREIKNDNLEFDELKKLRTQLSKVIEKNLLNSKFDIEVKSDNRDLIINIYKRFYDEKPSDNLLNEVIDNLIFQLFSRAANKQSDFNLMVEIYNNIVFKSNFEYADNKNFKLTRTLVKKSLEKLIFPINEPRFKRLLE